MTDTEDREPLDFVRPVTDAEEDLRDDFELLFISISDTQLVYREKQKKERRGEGKRKRKRKKKEKEKEKRKRKERK